jgi:predicted kinase
MVDPQRTWASPSRCKRGSRSVSRQPRHRQPGNRLPVALLSVPVSLLVLVSGLPASGKSTLARRLSADLCLPLVSRDRLRPTLGSLIAVVPGEEEGWRVGRALDQIINHFVHRVLDVGIGAVIDANFNWPEQMEAVRELVAERRPDCFEVCLWADPDVLRGRFSARGDPPLSDELTPIFEKAVSRPRVPVLRPPAKVVEFDTTDFTEIEAAYTSLITELRQRLVGSQT